MVLESVDAFTERILVREHETVLDGEYARIVNATLSHNRCVMRKWNSCCGFQYAYHTHSNHLEQPTHIWVCMLERSDTSSAALVYNGQGPGASYEQSRCLSSNKNSSATKLLFVVNDATVLVKLSLRSESLHVASYLSFRAVAPSRDCCSLPLANK